MVPLRSGEGVGRSRLEVADAEVSWEQKGAQRAKGLLISRQRGPGHLARDGSLCVRSVPTVLTPALGQTEVGRRVRVPAAGLSN